MEIINILISVIAVFFAGATLWQKVKADKARKEKEELEKTQKQQEEDRKNLIKDVSIEVKHEVREILGDYVCVRDAELSHKEIKESFNEIAKQIDAKIDTLISKVEDTDLKNIRNMIIQFADDLRSGALRSEVSYKHVLDSYDYYKNVLKANSYIDKEIEFIKEEWERVHD